MKPYKIKQMAQEMGISPTAALKMRMRYLAEQLVLGSEWEESGSYEKMPEIMQGEAIEEMTEIALALKTLNNTPHENTITPDMLAKAKAVSIDSLIQFKHGKAKCFAHDDNKPSMYFGNKTNTARCPVCNKAWDSIQILIERDGYTFTGAVQNLCSR